MFDNSKFKPFKLKLFSVLRQNIEGFVFFGNFYLYLWLILDLRLVPNTGGGITRFPVFYRGWDFFYDECAVPGGTVEYLSSLLVQSFYYSWLGAIIVTLQSCLIYFFSRKFIHSINMSKFSLVCFSGPVIILVIYNKYFYFFNIVNGLLVCLVFVYLYKLLSDKKSQKTSFFIYLILSVVLYIIAGGSLLIFAILCIIYELIKKSRLILAVAELLLVFTIVYIVGVGIYQLTTLKAFTCLLPIASNFDFFFDSSKMALSLYLFLPFISIFLWIFQKMLPTFVLNSKSDKSQNIFRLRWIQFMILMIVTLLVIYFSYDIKKKNFYTADFYANHRNWSKALAAAESVIDKPLMISIVNRALFHKGSLPQYMFLYPQKINALFYTLYAPLDEFRGLCQGTDLCIDLGLFNSAEHHVWQKIETFGPLPELIKRLATIKMVKGDMDAARVCLNTLAKTLSHSDWAEEYLAKLENDSTLSNDSNIQNLRARMLKTDHIIGEKGPTLTLIKLLEENRYNKMAFEYLMALYLLHKDTGGIVRNLHRLPNFGYIETPKPYEEAFLLHLMKSYPRNVTVPDGFKISPESKKRFKAFSKFIYSHNGNPGALDKEVTTNQKNHYYEYFFHGYKSNGEEK